MKKHMETEEVLPKQKGMIKYFWIYAKKYWWAFLIGPLLMAFEAYTDLKQPAIMQSLIDIGIVNGDFDFIKSAGLQMIMYAFIGFIAGIGAAVFCTIASLKFGARLRDGVYEKIQSFSFGNIDKFKTGSLITRMTNDVTQISNATHQMIRMLVRSSSLLIGSLAYILIMSKDLTIVIYISIPFILLIAFAGTKHATPLFRRLQKKLDGVNIVMQENLAGARVVKAFVRSDYEIDRFKKSNKALKDTAIKGFRILAIVSPLIGLVLNIAICFALYLGGKYTINGTIKMGEFLAYLRYLSTLLMALTQVAMTIIGLIRARASKDRILEVLKVTPDINDNHSNKSTIIKSGKVEFKNVYFSYDTNSTDDVLENISFIAKPGEMIAILGETGAGKTTLINLISRLYDIKSGKILIDDIDIEEYTLNNLRKSIGFSLQRAVLFSGTIYENISYGNRKASKDDVINAAKAASAHDFIMEMEKGYNTHVEQKGVNLSGGQKQRIAIARAILISPKIMILDDSTSAVDVQTENNIQFALRTVLKDSTSFVVAQRISTVLKADKILILEDGKIVAQGNHKQLIASSELYKDIFNSQLGKVKVYNEQ